MFVENLEFALNDWSNGALEECPNAREDALIEEAFQRTDRHAAWRVMDPRDPREMAGLAAELGIGPVAEKGSMQSVMRLLYGSESVGSERMDFYHLHTEIRAVEARLRESMARKPSQWELVSAAVCAATDSDGAAPRLTALLGAYQGLEDAMLEESLGAEARLAG